MCSQFGPELTCQEGDCFVQIPDGEFIFKTGRIDCISKSSQNQHYLANKIEISPNQGWNGEKTVKYFEENFNLTGRESLALMENHTLGMLLCPAISILLWFSIAKKQLDIVTYPALQEVLTKSFLKKIRKFSNQTNLLNNKYYKVLTQQPQDIRDGICMGKMNGSKAEHFWLVAANLFLDTYEPPNPWATIGQYERGPVCEGESGVEDSHFFDNPKLNGKAQEAGFQTGYQWCCDQLKSTPNLNNCVLECIGDALGMYQGHIRDALGTHQGCIGDALFIFLGAAIEITF